MALMEKFSMPVQSLTDIRIDDNAIAYEMQYEDGTTSVVQVINDNNGLQFNVTEGDLYDEVLITPDNKFFYNGNEVVVSQIEDETTFTNDEIQRRGGAEHYFQKKPSFGKTSDYTYYAGSYKKNNITLGVNFQNATKGGFSAVVTAVIFKLAGILWQGVIPIFLTAFCTDLLYQAQSSNPLGDTVSYSSIEYYHKDYKKFRINSFTSCKYINGIGYTKANCRGSMETFDYFYCIDHN